MRMRTLIGATALGLAVLQPTFDVAQAQTLRVMSGAPSRALQVPMNRAVVVESDTAFAELSIANPGIADISTDESDLEDVFLQLTGGKKG